MRVVSLYDKEYLRFLYGNINVVTAIFLHIITELFSLIVFSLYVEFTPVQLFLTVRL